MEETKNYELRGLEADDIFPMATIISEIGFSEFKSCFETDEVKELINVINKAEDTNSDDTNSNDANSDARINQIGFRVVLNIAGIVVKNLPKCRNEIYTLLSGLSGLTKQEIAKLPLLVFTNMITDVIKKDEFKDFIKAVSKFI